MTTNLSNVLRAATAMPWAIAPEKLEAICAVLEMRANAGHLSPDVIAANTAERRPSAFALGGAVAIIPMTGVIAPRMNVMTEMSGGCSAEQLGQQIASAIENPQVSAIVLDCDSPGGQVSGIPELAAQIRAWRQAKPIIAVANHMIASAAYWLASSATEVVAAPSAEVGSIGVFTIHTDASRADTAAGLQRTLVKAGLYKGEDLPYFALSDDAKAHMQAKVDDYMRMFAADVAAGRETSVASVMAGYGQGQMLTADAALAAGLIDRIATLDEVVADLAGGSASSASSASAGRRTAARAALAPAPVAATTSDDVGGAPECPDCGTPMQPDDDEYVCPDCGYRTGTDATAADVTRLGSRGDAVAASLIAAVVVDDPNTGASRVTGRHGQPITAADIPAEVNAAIDAMHTRPDSTLAPPTVRATAMSSHATRRGGRAPTQAPLPAIRITASPAKEHNVSDDQNTSAFTGADDITREREIQEISALATAHAVQDQLPKWIEASTPLDGPQGVRAQIANVLRERLAKGPQTRTHAADLSEKEERTFSYARAILSALDGTNCFEREYSQEVEKNARAMGYTPHGGANSIFVPTTIATAMDGQRPVDVRKLRAAGVDENTIQRVMATGLDSGTSTKGQELKFTQYGGFIPMLRNKARVLQAGARMLQGLSGPVTFAKQTGAGTFAWVGENGASDVSDSNLLLGTVTLSPKTGMSTTSFSRQLLRLAVEDIESLVRNDIASIHAIGIDSGALLGSGASNQPTGVYNTSGVGVVALGTNGAAPTFANVINQQVQVGQANADEDIGDGAYITTPGIKGTLQTTSKLSNTIGEAIWNDSDIVAGKRGFSTNQVQSTLTKGTGTNLHAIYYGIWQQLLIGEWGAMEILVDPLRLKKQGMIEVTSFEMLDIAVRYAGAFSLVKDAISAF